MKVTFICYCCGSLPQWNELYQIGARNGSSNAKWIARRLATASGKHIKVIFKWTSSFVRFWPPLVKLSDIKYILILHTVLGYSCIEIVVAITATVLRALASKLRISEITNWQYDLIYLRVKWRKNSDLLPGYRR
jgi:hypothetical protein